MPKKDEILEFYKYYQIDHWIYKAAMLKRIIENFDSVKDIILKNVIDVIDKDCINMLKAEIHFTLFQMIETLFELIFALEKRDDKNLWLNLSFTQSTSRNSYKRIEKISKGEIDFLDIPVKIPSGKEIPLIYYIFYFGIEPFPIKRINENFEKIKQSLIILAKFFSDRFEYNAYKHSLRFFQLPLAIELLGETNGNEIIPILKASSDNTLTFLHNERGEIKMVSKSFDYEIDYEKIIICHNLISNIIKPRKRSFFNPDGKVKLAYFDKYVFDSLDKPSYTLHRLESTIGWLKKNNKKNRK